MAKILPDPGFTRILVSVSAILALSASGANGQRSAGMGTWGFVNARYDTRSSTSIYTGYGWHAVFAMGGVVHNPRTGYAELVGGVGGAFRTGAAEHWVVFAAAQTRAGSLAEVFWLPKLRTGSLTSSATVKLSGAKLSIAPLAITRPLGRRLSGGVATELAAAEGARTRFGTGLELRLKLPGAALGVDAMRDVRGNETRLRLFFASIF